MVGFFFQRVVISFADLRYQAFVLVVLVEELPAILLIKRRIESRVPSNCFGQELHDSVLFVVWNKVRARATTFLLYEAKHNMLLVSTSFRPDTKL